MFKLIRRIVCLLVIAAIVFFVIALQSGGEKFRWFGEKTGGAIKESSKKLGERADEIKVKKDEAGKYLEKFTDIDKEEAKDKSSETSKEKENKPEDSGDKEGGNKKAGDSQHTLWDRILEKIRALKKG